MIVDVKKIDDIKRELKFRVDKERVTKKLDEVYDELGKVAKVKGFRQGKIPRHVLKAQHGKYAEEETIKKLIPEVYQEGIQKENINPIDLPEIEDVKFQDGIITFTAKLDIKPLIKIKDYKGIKVKRKSMEVTEEELNKTLEYFKQGQGQEKDVALDDTFARGLGYPNLVELKKSISKQLELDKDRQNRTDVENQIIENLLKKTKFAIPKSLVNRQAERRIDEAKHRLKHQGLPDEEINKRAEEMQKDVKEQAERDVKVYLILDKIAELENIEVKEGDNLPLKVIEFLLKEAKWEE